MDKRLPLLAPNPFALERKVCKRPAHANFFADVNYRVTFVEELARQLYKKGEKLFVLYNKSWDHVLA